MGALVEHVAQDLLTEVDPAEADLDARHHGDGSLGRVGHGGEAVDGAHFEWEFEAADRGEVGGEDQEVGAGGERWECEREGDRHGDRRVGFAGLSDAGDLVFERDEGAGIDFDGDVHVERSVAGAVGVEIDLPGLPVGVRLDEVTLVVDVEAVFGDMVLEIGDESLQVDDGHR